MSIQSEIDRIIEARDAIATEIENKGVSATGATLSELASKVAEISQSDVKTVNDISPDENGNIELTASDIGAISTGGVSFSEYYICKSDANNPNKLVSNYPSNSINNGDTITVLFTNGDIFDGINDADITLTVNTSEARDILYNGEQIPREFLVAGGIYTFTFSTAGWNLIGNYALPATSTPLDPADTAAVGTSTTYARADHVHPKPDIMTGATSSTAGKSGLVPAPAAGDQASFLRGDGTWQTPANTTYSVATQSTNGLMSATDKTKLDGFDSASSYATASTASSLDSRITSVESRLSSKSISFAEDTLLANIVPTGGGTWTMAYWPGGKIIVIQVQREGDKYTNNFIYCYGNMLFTIRMHPNNNSGATLYANCMIQGTTLTMSNWYCGYEYTGTLAQNLCTYMDVRAIYPALSL